MPSPKPVIPLAYRPKEAAKAIGVSERTLLNWTKNGEIPHIRRGSIILYAVTDLEEWLRRQIRHA